MSQSQVSTTIWWLGSRTAIEILFGPRIIIPSMSAWPPIVVFFFIRAGERAPESSLPVVNFAFSL
jgi:hypothetical protein